MRSKQAGPRCWLYFAIAAVSIFVFFAVEQLIVLNSNPVDLDVKDQRLFGNNQSRMTDVSKASRPDGFWTKNVTEEFPAVSEDVAERAKLIGIQEGAQNVTLNNPDGTLEDREIFFRHCEPKDSSAISLNILLLHGASFKSETWQTLGTLQLFAALGYSVTAIDLPGFGKTKGPKVSGTSAGQLIYQFCLAGELLKKPLVIVAPSMAGSYAVPYLMNMIFRDAASEDLAMIFISPVETENYPDEEYEKIQIPILNLYGSRDAAWGQSVAKKLELSKNAKSIEIPDAGHAAYMNQPTQWHRIASGFLGRVAAWYSGRRGGATNRTTTDVSG